MVPTFWFQGEGPATIIQQNRTGHMVPENTGENRREGCQVNSSIYYVIIDFQIACGCSNMK